MAGKIGSFGGVAFEVSSKKVLTPSEIKRSEQTRWQVHETIGTKPLPEFIGRGQETVSFHLVLKTSLGVSPISAFQKLRTLQDEGKTSSFMLGKRMISGHPFYIEDIQETYRHIDNSGNIHTIEADLTLKEYVEIKKTKAKTTSKASAKKKSSSKSSKKVTAVITISVGMLNARISPSLKGRIKKVLRKGQKLNVYGTKKTDITWYDLGGGLWCSANSKYSKARKK